MQKNTLLFLVTGLLLLNASCKKNQDLAIPFSGINDSIQKVYAPDKRVAIYAIHIEETPGKLILKGETNLPEALKALKQELGRKKISYTDSVTLLPDASVGEKRFAVVNNSVANIRSKGKHAAELGTQALLGMTLKVFKITGDFYRVQTPDAYISWVDHGGVVLMDKDEVTAWQNMPKLIYTAITGFVYTDENESAKVSDIVLGGQLGLLEETKTHYKVRYPDKRTGFIRKTEAKPLKKWLTELKPSGDLVEAYARDLMGTPYLWGGTSVKAMDCSGFTKTVYLMNGLIIPRDASQQINAGLDVDPDLSFKNLQKGDLMFFGKKATDSTKQRVTHVGIWLGDGLFIHESMRVRLSSVNPGSPFYDKMNTNRYLGSRRYFGQEKDPLIVNMKDEKAVTRIIH